MSKPKASLYLDAEYSNSTEIKFKPIALAGELLSKVEGKLTSKIFRAWNVSGYKVKETRDYLIKLREEFDLTIVSFNVLAEARYLISLGLNPLNFKWVCLKVEYEQLLNSNYDFEYGSHLDDKGEVIFTKPPVNKWDKQNMSVEEQEALASSKRAKRSLMSASHKLLRIKGDLSHKKAMQAMCIRHDDEELEENKRELLDYVVDDIKDLSAMHREINKNILSLVDYDQDSLYEIQRERGRYVAHAAIREARGYPVDLESLKSVQSKVQGMVNALCEDINKNLKGILQVFTFEKKKGTFKENQKQIKEFIRKRNPNWPTTDKGAISLSEDSFKAYRDYKYDYPPQDPYAQITRYKSFMKSLNGIKPKRNPKPDDKTIFDFIGSDERVRPYAPPYSSQTSRTYPSATSFIPAKAAWMRSLIKPKEGRVIVGVDFSSQEFLLGAIESIDENMFEAYTSGDPYMWFAIMAKAAPKGANKETHAQIRDVFKTLTLAMGYGMGAQALANKLTAVTGKEWTKPEANGLINLYYSIYSDYDEKRIEITEKYREEGYLMLRDGWTLFGDNPTPTSILNFPIQGGAASIMRRAEMIANQRGVPLIYTLHDALYAEMWEEDLEKKLPALIEAMKGAFKWYYSEAPLQQFNLESEFDYDERQEEMASATRLDSDIWGPTLDTTLKEISGIKVNCQNVYIDKRAKKDYEFFSKYF